MKIVLLNCFNVLVKIGMPITRDRMPVFRDGTLISKKSQSQNAIQVRSGTFEQLFVITTLN